MNLVCNIPPPLFSSPLPCFPLSSPLPSTTVVTVWFNKSNTEEFEVVFARIPIEDDDIVKEDRKLVVRLEVQREPNLRVESQTANISVVEDDGMYVSMYDPYLKTEAAPSLCLCMCTHI